MRLRTSKIVKLFAVLLFSLEMTMPAFFSIASHDTSHERTLVNAADLPDFCSTLVFEESENEEEDRDGKDHKFAPELIDFTFAQSHIAHPTIHILHDSWIEPSSISATRPPLFTLLHSYLI